MMSNTFSLETNVSLAPYTWFKTGGPARFFAEPETDQQFKQAINFAFDNNLAIFVLGEGANILISDEGFDGLVIRPILRNIVHTTYDTEYALVTAQAGASFPHLITYCLQNHLIGLEEFSGIPGTVGGSVFINIHYFEFLLSSFLVQARVIHKDTGIIEIVDNAWFQFGYNYSQLHTQSYYLVDATFKVKKVSADEAAYARGRSVEIIRHRQNRYPKTGTCGSFFRNFFEHEVTLESAGKKLIYVAYYLDKIGVKGHLSCGDAIVSYQHANMLVNKGQATARDILTLARTMQELVHKNFGIIPQPECQLIGFKENYLL
ncbi:MAG: UDP-N-acetylmuramate dehydrogenase [Candidatus Babeliaceae bacterium]